METRKVESFTGRFSKNCIIFFFLAQNDKISLNDSFARFDKKKTSFRNNYIKLEVSLWYNFRNAYANYILIDPNKLRKYDRAHVWESRWCNRLVTECTMHNIRVYASICTYTRASSSSPDINVITNSNKIQPWLVNFVRRTQTPICPSCISWFHEGDPYIYRSVRRMANFDRRVLWRIIDRESRLDNPFSNRKRRVLHSCRQVPPSVDPLDVSFSP